MIGKVELLIEEKRGKKGGNACDMNVKGKKKLLARVGNREEYQGRE